MKYKKKTLLQKGILVGIFFESPSGIYEMDPISLTVYGERSKKKKDEKDEKDEKDKKDEKDEKDKKSKDEDYSKNNKKGNYNWLYGILGSILITCICGGCKYCCSKCSEKAEDLIYVYGKLEIKSDVYFED